MRNPFKDKIEKIKEQTSPRTKVEKARMDNMKQSRLFRVTVFLIIPVVFVLFPLLFAFHVISKPVLLVVMLAILGALAIARLLLKNR